MALSASAAMTPPCRKPRELQCASRSHRPISTLLSPRRENSGSHGAVTGLVLKCGMNPSGACGVMSRSASPRSSRLSGRLDIRLLGRRATVEHLPVHSLHVGPDDRMFGDEPRLDVAEETA